MKTYIVAASVLMTSIALTSCKKEDPTPPQASSVDTPTDPGGSGGTGGTGGTGGDDPVPTCDILNVGNAWVSQATSQGPAGTHLSNEVYWNLPTDCFLTGIGVNVASDDVKMMKLYYRKLEDNCSFSSQMSHTLGPDTGLPAEQVFTAPYGHAITGLGLLVENNNVTRMKVYFRELIGSSSGGFYLGPSQSQNLGNTNGFELSLTTSMVNGVSTNNTVLTGVGLRGQNSGIYQIEFRLGRLQSL